MKIGSLLSSSALIHLAIFAGRITPARFGFWFFDRVGVIFASNRDRKSVKALRQNLRVVLGSEISPEDLDALVIESFRKHARRLFEFYHYLDRPKDLDRLIKFNTTAKRLIAEWNNHPFGVLIMGLHLSAFDLGMIALARNGLKILALSVPNPNSQYSKQNEIRLDHGMEIIPISVRALQIARLRLQNNGMVMTGLDRAAPESSYQPRFFGLPSQLPVYYTRLAKKAGVPIIVVGVHDLPDGSHEIDCSEYIWMEPRDDPREEIIYNTEKVLAEAEKFISAHPDQWAMFFPVWPNSAEEDDLAKG